MTARKNDKAKPSVAPCDAGTIEVQENAEIEAEVQDATESHAAGFPVIPDHKSILADLIWRSTRMQVYEVEDGVAVRPNRGKLGPSGKISVPIKDIWLYPLDADFRKKLSS